MKTRTIIVLLPLIGYVGLWVLGTALFLLYFRVFKVPFQSDYVSMIERVPAALAIVTVPICSLASFSIAARLLLGTRTPRPPMREQVFVAVACFAFTIAMDLITTVLIERMDILVYPVDLMYLFAWLVVIPAVLLGGKRGR